MASGKCRHTSTRSVGYRAANCWSAGVTRRQNGHSKSETSTSTTLLPALPRMIFVTHGSMTIADRTLNEGEAWHGSDAVTFKPDKAGVACWRWV